MMMIANISNENKTWIDNDQKFSLPSSVRFWLIIIFEIPSLTCSLLLLCYLIIDRTLRKALKNPIIVVVLLLLVNLFFSIN